MQLTYDTEKITDTRQHVYENGHFGRVYVGLIDGAKGKYLAESAAFNLGYHKTRKGALQAIIDHRASSLGEKD